MAKRVVWPLLRDTVREWRDDRASRVAAALAFYTTLSLAPLLVIIVAIAGAVFGERAAHGEVVSWLQEFMGATAAAAIEAMIRDAAQSQVGGLATLLGASVMLYSASRVFTELQDAMNVIWNAEPRQNTVLSARLRARLLSFAMVLGTGFLLVVSLATSAVLASVGKYYAAVSSDWAAVGQVVAIVGSIAITTLLFAALYKYLPDVEVRWQDVGVGAFVTALMFVFGKSLVALYLGRASASSAYGAASSFMLLLLWVYYSTQVVLFGAELTQVYAKRFGQDLHPSQWATQTAASSA